MKVTQSCPTLCNPMFCSEPDAGPKEVLENVRNAIDVFVGDAPQFDDITMLSLKYNGGKKS